LTNSSTTKTALSAVWESYGGHSPVSIFFSQVSPISEEAIALIDQNTRPVIVPRGKLILKKGSSGDELYFIVKGVARGMIVEDGREITTWINEENEVIGTIRNLGIRRPSEEMVQALETCELVAIPYDLIERLYREFPETNVVGRIILEESYRDAEERAYIARIHSAEKRYKRLMETRPNLCNRIPLKHIASYLGMTLETLSRIRNKRNF
jgi:CRP-like cAMP-binding protein